MPKRIVTLYIADEVYERMKRYCDKHSIRYSNFVEEAIREHLDSLEEKEEGGSK